MAEVFMNTCPKCGGPTRLETRNFKQSCSSCNRIAELEAENKELRDVVMAFRDVVLRWWNSSPEDLDEELKQLAVAILGEG